MKIFNSYLRFRGGTLSPKERKLYFKRAFKRLIRLSKIAVIVILLKIIYEMALNMDAVAALLVGTILCVSVLALLTITKN